jgi:hypothetical protein
MNNFYLYRFVYDKQNENQDACPYSATVIFCPGESIDKNNLQIEIKLFYQKNHHTDEIYVIGGQNIKSEVTKIFKTERDEVFQYLHKADKDFLDHNLHLLIYDKNGVLKNGKNKLDDEIQDRMLNEGLQHIFLTRGGFVESKGAHHFVFPSGKHCNKFLRTGNILLHSSEIYFIAFTLLRYYNEEKHTQIYCDTSSINTIAFALLELKRRLIKDDSFKPVPIESFSSYEGLQDSKNGYFANSLILISASTSGNILDKIKKANKLAKKQNMIILFFLGSKDAYETNSEQILCNLTHSDQNKNGIHYYKTFDESNCEHCQSGSFPVNVLGDVFLLEKPKVNLITLGVKDSPKDLSRFVKEFKSVEYNTKNIFKVSYKENEREINIKYEIYFDFYQVLSSLDSYKDFSKKIDDYINQYIPSNTKYLIYLNDKGSKLLADLIFDKIKINYNEDNLPVKISQDKINEIESSKIGAAVVVASCISNGKNLLYISRSLRTNDNLRIIYFIALTRTKNEEQLNFLKSNLKQGGYGNETNSFVNVYNFYMINNSVDTTWINEIVFLQRIKEYYDRSNGEDESIKKFLDDRISEIEEASGDESKGLTDNLFYPEIIKGERQRLRKNFAFLSFSDLSQADVYFTIGSIINNLRNSSDLSRSLIQTEYVRNILEPGNFNRFNDGVIQSSILRLATKNELSYHLEYDISKNMFDILSIMIKNYQTTQAEALFEFLYALTTQKMTLKKPHLEKICGLIKENIEHNVYLLFVDYIENEILKTA